MPVEQLVLDHLHHLGQRGASESGRQVELETFQQFSGVHGARSLVVQPVDRQRQHVDARLLQRRPMLLELVELFHAGPAPAGPQAQQRRPAAGLRGGGSAALQAAEGQRRQRHRLRQHHPLGVAGQLPRQAGRRQFARPRRRRPGLRRGLSLDEAVSSSRRQPGVGLRLASGPTDDDAVDLIRPAQPEVQPFARLRQEAFAGAQCLDQRRPAVMVYLHPGADRIAVAHRAHQQQRQRAVRAPDVVAEEPYLRPAAVHEPQVQVAVKVPVDDRRRAAVVVEVQPADG